MANSSSKIAIVVQRYGSSIIGGAESHARLVGKQLQHRAGYTVEVYTTTSSNYLAWENTFQEGSYIEEGILVHRFCPRGRRGIKFKVFNSLLKSGWHWAPVKIQRELEHQWIRSQGPYVPQLVETLVKNQHQYAAVIFFTYLYYPTIIGLPQISRPKILIPTAHDEAPFYLSLVGRMLKAADVVYANTDVEGNLIHRAHGVLRTKIKVVGVGLEKPPEVRLPAIKDGHPLRILYLGRVGRAKAVDQLTDFFDQCLAADPSLAATLRIAGPLDGSFVPVANTAKIQYLGVLNDNDKQEELLQADIVINPSHHESLSLLVLEGIMAHKVILVQKSSPVLSDYAQKYKTVISYGNADDLGQALRLAQSLISNPGILVQHLESAAKDVEARYGWQKITDTFIGDISLLAGESHP